MLTSAFFACSFLGMYTSVFLYKKSERELNGFAWLNISFIIVLCYHALIAGIFTLIGIDVNLLSVGIADLVLCLVFFGLYSKKVIKIQKYYFKLKDACILVLVLLCVILRFFVQFGTELKLHYITSDPSVHLSQAMDVINSGNVQKMYFGSLTNALFMEFMSPIFSGFLMYKSFILMDGIMLFISGFSFFAIMRQSRNNMQDENWKLLIPEIILLLMYTFGYPLNNMVFGFGYLGMSVSIVATLVVVTNMYLQEDEIFYKIALMILCFGISVSYVLFAPVIYISVFICITYRTLKDKKVIGWICDCLGVFLIPSILTVIFCFFSMFSGNISYMQDGIKNEGYIYQDIFMNAWIISLPLLLGLFSCFKKKVVSMEIVSICMMVIFILVMGLLGLIGLISPYYFYKSAYVMSLFMYVFAYQGIVCWSKESLKTLLAFCVAIVLLFGSFFGKIEERIAGLNSNFILYKKVPTYLDIYEFNRQAISYEIYDENKIDLYKKVYDNCKSNAICVADWLDCYWYEALTNQRMDQDKYYPWLIGQEQYWANISQDNNIKYLLVLKDSEIYTQNESRFVGLKKEYENDAGFIFVLDKTSRQQLINGGADEDSK